MISFPSDTRARDLRIAAGAMLGIAAVWRILPVHPPFVCPLRTVTGIPCPGCGMTRAVVAGVHGDILGSLRYNPAGLLVIALAILIVVRPRFPAVRIPVWVVVTAACALWVYNVTLNPTF